MDVWVASRGSTIFRPFHSEFATRVTFDGRRNRLLSTWWRLDRCGPTTHCRPHVLNETLPGDPRHPANVHWKGERKRNGHHCIHIVRSKFW